MKFLLSHTAIYRQMVVTSLLHCFILQTVVTDRQLPDSIHTSLPLTFISPETLFIFPTFLSWQPSFTSKMMELSWIRKKYVRCIVNRRTYWHLKNLQITTGDWDTRRVLRDSLESIDYSPDVTEEGKLLYRSEGSSKVFKETHLHKLYSYQNWKYCASYRAHTLRGLPADLDRTGISCVRTEVALCWVL
jgi:hypothetical protein